MFVNFRLIIKMLLNFKILDDIIKMPKIMFEVASYDSWNRYRTEGYTWTQLPMKPGEQAKSLISRIR